MTERRIEKVDEAEVRDRYKVLTKALIQKGRTITTMESCTSGQIASLITDTEGASAIMKGAFITYCNEAKIMQGVPAPVIDTYSVYSVETAKAMAIACREAYQADIGIGVTGTMGNIDPANEKVSVPGRAYIAICTNGNILTQCLEIEPQPTRLAYKFAVAGAVCKLVCEMEGLTY